VITELHGVRGWSFENNLHDFLESTGGAGHEGRTSSVREVANDPRETFGHELSRSPGIGVAFEGHDDLYDLSLHGAHHALDAGQPANGLLNWLSHSQLQFSGSPSRALNEEIEAGKCEVREEVSLQGREADYSCDGPNQCQSEDPAFTRQHPVKPTTDQRPVLRCVDPVRVVGHGRIKRNIRILGKIRLSGHGFPLRSSA
jgi:hypothetical protein